MLNVDETGHKDDGQRMWTWCFPASLFTVFKISPSRSSDVLIEVLGQEFAGVLGCDYFSAYRKYLRLNENVALQFCLAHLIRDIKFLVSHPDPRNQQHGRELIELTRKLFRIINRHDNTLARPLRDYGPRDRVDVIVTNPPFGGTEEDAIESNFHKALRTRETADLFLVLIMHLLKPVTASGGGGRGAIVLPDGTLFGEGVKTRIKEKLLDECNLHTIVRLPNGVFNPYTGIKTNLLFFTKGEPTRDIWFYEHPYPPGYKSYSKTKPIRIEEFGPEKKWWGQPDARGGFKGRTGGPQAWKVLAADIKAGGYNMDIKNPHNADSGPGDPDQLLAELERIRHEGQQTLARLKQELADALRDG